ncbi:MAG: hypothetical protein FJ100_19850 [Deltaproteobacteria bacterium]|nr:hypothetical protein [Deltaproteobacteria bacterium]
MNRIEIPKFAIVAAMAVLHVTSACSDATVAPPATLQGDSSPDSAHFDAGGLANDTGTNAQEVNTADLADAGSGSANCNKGEGCFMESCTKGSDCKSGWCVEHMGNKVCSQPCIDTCPEGWQCKQVTGPTPDLSYVCVSPFANLCRPCHSGADCAGAAGTQDACVVLGEEGHFCGAKCGPGIGTPKALRPKPTPTKRHRSATCAPPDPPATARSPSCAG